MSLSSISYAQEVPITSFILLGLRRYVMRTRYLIFVAIAVVMVGMAWLISGPETISFLYPMMWVLVLMPGLHLLGLYYLTKTNLLLKSRHHVTANDEGLLLEGKGFHSFYSWEVFTDMKVYDHWILVFVSRNQAIYLYLPAIEDLGEREIMRTMIKTEITTG